MDIRNSQQQKLRVFAWKAATASLAVRTGLHRRIPETDPVCTICGCEEEDDHHAIIRCTLARALREEIRKFWTLPAEEDLRYSGKEWLLFLLGNASEDMRSKLIFLLWRVWHHRNNVVHGDGKASISASVPFIVNYHQSFLTATCKASLSQNSSEDPLRWVAPMEGNLKANVDAGWDQASKHAGIGIIIRNHRGEPIITEWRFIPVCASAEEAEVQACLMGMKHLIDLQCWPATLESDCLRAVQAINADGHEMSANWALLYEARELLRVYQNIEVRKVDRLSNGAAHVLAQLGKAGFSSVLHDSAPECVQDLIINGVKVL